jgi:hypothetical protein
MLTEPDEKVRRDIAKMTGKEAKRAGKSQTVEAKFEGKTHALGSEAHHDLIFDQGRDPRQVAPASGVGARFC